MLVDIVPLGGVPGRYTYSVPKHLESGAVVGRRVAIPFGPRHRVGVIVGAAAHPPEGPLRELAELLDDGPLLVPEVLELCRWAADYYEAPLSHALRAALPPGALGRETCTWGLTDAGRTALVGAAHSPAVRQALRAIELGETGLVPEKKLRALERDGLLCATRVTSTPPVPMVDFAVLKGPTENPVAPRHRLQHAVYAALISTPRVAIDELSARWPAARQTLRKFEQRGWAAIEAVPWDAGRGTTARAAEPRLTEDQSCALAELERALRSASPATYLLEGVTGSGKTEVYLRLIGTTLEEGGQALVIVPEIALTPQLSARFRERFGGRVAVLHSGLTDRERTAEWYRIHRGEAPIVVGARSGLFAPLANPRVLIVDEEHDPSFKQESGLRYHGRDLAVVRGKLGSALVVLGSATPSLETLHNVARGRYRRLAMPTRVDDRALPPVELVDLRGRKRAKPEHGVAPSGLLSEQAILALQETFARGEQSIVFLNRRGHSTALLCRDCGDVRRCDACAVAMTWHEKRSRLICHYCGRREQQPETCATCGSARLLLTGAGTEKLEDELAKALPGARVARLDRDTAATTSRLEAILGRFAARELDVLVGTQMVTKGHDFPGVTLVCVLLADAALHQPDFRSAERTCQLLTQVAGRAGRGTAPGRVVVQTYTPEAPAVAAIAGHDYKTFARAELLEREAAGYPPFKRLCLVRCEGEDEQSVRRHAEAAARALRSVRDVELLGPAPSPLAKLKGAYRMQLLVKTERRETIGAAAAALAPLLGSASGGPRLSLDVDPVNMS